MLFDVYFGDRLSGLKILVRNDHYPMNAQVSQRIFLGIVSVLSPPHGSQFDVARPAPLSRANRVRINQNAGQVNQSSPGNEPAIAVIYDALIDLARFDAHVYGHARTLHW